MKKHRIAEARPILLTAPYSTPDNIEVRRHLPHGLRTCGMVRLVLEDGLTGLGEAYIAVFAPAVFTAIVDLLAPYVVGRFVEDKDQIVNDLGTVTGYWSRQGAARHVVSAFDIALHDLAAKREGEPLFRYLNPSAKGELELYASGGDSPDRDGMLRELDEVRRLGINVFKIRARKHETEKASRTMRDALERGIRIAIDMTQNLVVPSQTVDDVLAFHAALPEPALFLEEPLGPDRIAEYPLLRKKLRGSVAGGETITHPDEMLRTVAVDSYDIAQPDATVIGGISALKTIFESPAVEKTNTKIFVHCWGGPVGMAANYHAAAAWDGKIAEWPLPAYPIREDVPPEPWNILDGRLILSEQPGLGMNLTDAIIDKYAFRPTAVYSCLTQ